MNPGQEIGQVSGPLDRVLWTRDLLTLDERRDGTRRSEHLTRGVEKDGLGGGYAVPAGDLQSVEFCGSALGVWIVGHPLDDEAARPAAGRHRIEHMH